jgi:NADH:ubiquinone oxidoreductase subunit 6 (subunit J)
MNNKKKNIENNFFLGFGIVVVISGIFLIVQKDLVSGIGGTLVGALLIFQNLRQNKASSVANDN